MSDGKEHQVVVYRYGCPSWVDLDEAGMQQLRLAHELRNKLVELEKAHQVEIQTTWAEHSEVENARRALDEATLACEQIASAMLRHRQQDRTTKPRPEDKARLKEARALRRDLKGKLKVEKNAAMPVMKERFSELKNNCRACLVRQTSREGSLYKEFVQERGLAWGTFNDIAARWKETEARIAADRKQGKPADLRFQRFLGEGRITTQVQRDLQGKRREVWGMTGEGKHGTFQMTARARHPLGALDVTLPVVKHRELPEDADVTEVKVVRRRIGPYARLSAHLTARLPMSDAPGKGSVVAVRLSWTSRPGKWLRVATIASSRELPPVSPDIAGIVNVDPNGMSAEVGFDPRWTYALERDDRIRGHRDNLLDHLRGEIVSALEENGPLAEAVGVDAKTVARWRSPGRFVRLGKVWPADHPLSNRIEAWRKRDKHLWLFEASERDQVINRRRDAWRKVAAWLCSGSRSIVLHGLDLADLRQKGDVSEGDSEQARHSRRNATRAAPGELRQTIENAARRRGIELTYAKERIQ